MRNTKGLGECSEAIILAHLLKKGFAVLLPFGNNQAYDMVVDDGVALIRAQCKTGRRVNGVLRFEACRRSAVTGKRKSYCGLIDMFLIYFPENGKIYRMKINDVTVKDVSLRLDRPNGGPAHGYRWAKDYEY